MPDKLVTYLPNVRYLTGFSGSSACVLTGRRRRYLFTDFRYRDQAEKQVRGFQVRIVKGPLLEGFCEYVRSHRIKLNVLGVESDHLSHRDFLLLRRRLQGIRLRDVSGSVEKQRSIKGKTGVDRIRRAAVISDKALARLRRQRITGRSEREVAWMLERYMREYGSGPLPFEIIIASGPRSAMPHGVAGERKIGKGELVVIDFGASVDGYCCDMTRTFATGKLSRRQQRIYRTVREAQALAVKSLKPGVPCSEVDKLARDHIVKAGFGEAFGHSLGHGVGLEAHEAPLLAPRSKDVLAAGMAITIEPGIYTGRNGVRIEDTVLITRKGATPLTGFTREPVELR